VIAERIVKPGTVTYFLIPGTPYIIPGAEIELRMVSPELLGAGLSSRGGWR